MTCDKNCPYKKFRDQGTDPKSSVDIWDYPKVVRTVLSQRRRRRLSTWNYSEYRQVLTYMRSEENIQEVFKVFDISVFDLGYFCYFRQFYQIERITTNLDEFRRS